MTTHKTMSMRGLGKARGPLHLLAAALAVALLAAPARAEEEGKSDLDKETGTLELCPQVKGILKSAAASWERVKGKQTKESPKATHFKGKMSLPDGRGCELIVFKDGGSAYACDLHTTSCKKTKAQYEKFALELASCIGGDPQVKSGDGKMTTKWQKDGVQVIAQLKARDESCEITLYFEK